MAPLFFGLKGQKLHRAVATIAGMGFLLFGYDQGVMGGLLTLPAFVSTFPEMDTVNTEGTARARASEIQGLSIAIYEIGCMAGALTTLWVGDAYGRRKVIFAGAAVMTVGALLQCTSFGLPQFIVGRIVTGYGNGFITATVPVWQSECAKAEDRGYLVMIEGALITAGIAISYWIDFAFFFVPGQTSWRFPVAFQIFFAIFLMALVMSLPESPRWLCKKGRYEDAGVVFAALDDVDIDHPSVKAQIEEVRATLPLVESGGVKDIFSVGKEKHFWRASLGFWVQVMQQITGINLITYYAATIYETSIGLSPFNSKILAACNGTEYFIASFIAVYYIERLGRRKLMIIGAAGQSFTMALLTGMTYLAAKTDALPFPGMDNSNAGIVAAILLFIFNTFFAAGWLGIAWLVPSEITSLRVRAPAAGISTAANWSFNFMVVLITPIAFNTIGYYTYTIFAVINFLMVPVVYYLYPETAHRTLEEIDDIFEHANPMKPWSVVKIARDLPLRPKIEGGTDPEATYALRHRTSGKDVVEKDVTIEHVN